MFYFDVCMLLSHRTRRSQLLQMVSFSVKHSFLLQMTLCLGVVIGYPKFLQSIKGNADLHPNSLYDHHMNSVDGDVSWLKADKFGSRPDEGSLQFLQKRSRNIGSKSRRFLIDAEDAMELKLTWEEAQELLRPAPTSKPTIVMIEDYEFEEYDVSLLFISLFMFRIMEHILSGRHKRQIIVYANTWIMFNLI